MKRVLFLALAAACATRAAPSRQAPAQRFASGAEPAPFDPALKDHVRAAIPAVDALLRAEAARPEFPALAVGIVAGDELVWVGSAGSRDGAGGAVDERTVFRLGSITKVVTGLALLRLRDAGKLSFDDPVTDYVPELGGVVYPTRDSAPITIRHLVTHTSGLPPMGPLPLAGATEAQLLAALDGLALEFAPGSRVSYSNLAMALAGLVVARASGVPYREYVDANILAPLAMRETVWDGDHAAADRIATPHTVATGRPVAEKNQIALGVMEPAGGLYSTVSDAAKLIAYELSAEPPRAEPTPLIVRRSTLRESQRIAGHSPGGEHTFGVNWVVFRDPDLGRVVFHNGSTGDYSASLWLLPERSIGLIAFTNSGASAPLDRLAHAALSKLVAGLPVAVPTLGAPIQTAVDRVIAILAGPTREAVEQAFSPSFLAGVPAEQVVAVARDLDPGACAATPFAVRSDVEAVVRLTCARGELVLYLRVESDAPHRIVSAKIEPVSP